MHFLVKLPETGRKNMCRDKRTTNKALLKFLDLTFLQKDKNSVFRLCKQARKIECMYLAFENVKINSKEREPQSER